MPFNGIYSSSKWAIEALAEALSYGLRPSAVDVAIVEPGAYATNIVNVMIKPDDVDRLAPYGEFANVADQMLAGLGLVDKSQFALWITSNCPNDFGNAEVCDSIVEQTASLFLLDR